MDELYTSTGLVLEFEVQDIQIPNSTAQKLILAPKNGKRGSIYEVKRVS